MRLAIRTVLAAASLAAPVVLPSRMAAQERLDIACYAQHYQARAIAQREYQHTMERLVGSADPRLRPLAALARAEQVARIDARERAVEWLLQRDPRRLRLDRTANQWLDWGPAESAALARDDTAYARLEQRVAAARAAVAGHPDWPALRRLVQDSIGESPAHRAAVERLMAGARTPPRC